MIISRILLMFKDQFLFSDLTGKAEIKLGFGFRHIAAA